MKTLHIYRSKPIPMVRALYDELEKEGTEAEFHLYEERVDYDQLVEKIFQYDRVICWW